jgi:cytochrome c peroxidase
MRASGFIRPALLAPAVTVIALGCVIGFESLSFGAAIVGETRYTGVEAKAAAAIDAMKAEYRRPASIPFPKENPYTPQKAWLGKKLYFDTRLSLSSAQSCASCHNPGLGWGDGLAVSVGHGMAKLARRSPTLVNVAWGAAFMWDGFSPNLEEQALVAIKRPPVMNMPPEPMMERISSIAEYKPLFAAAFPNEEMSAITLAKAIATYERTVVSELAPFNTKGQCSSCHEGWNFTNDGFHDTGLPNDHPGRGKLVPDIVKMKQAFKTPGLREISKRGPYMHDGSISTLEQVIEHYDRGGVDRPSRSDLMKPLDLTPQEKSDLVAFMKTLTSNLDPTTMPVLPR